jgi:hypothetical protein
MDVEDRRVRVLRRLVAEVDADVRLVRSLVMREARVAVDPEQRPADGLRLGLEVRADLAQLGREVADELEGRLLRVLDVASLVRLEPLAVVVLAKLAQEREQRRREDAGADSSSWPVLYAT